MSSGFGLSGGRNRCFPFWQEFTRCHVQAETTSECANLFQDYKECLHHSKEVCSPARLACLLVCWLR
eukprot:jgi/Hompol1/4847/HPOL_003944-RA